MARTVRRVFLIVIFMIPPLSAKHLPKRLCRKPAEPPVISAQFEAKDVMI
jgi:hypothetical protein